MKIGKISETVYNRTILKNILKQPSVVLTEANVGETCAVFSINDNIVLGSASSSFNESINDLIIRATNKVAAGFATAVAVMIDAMYPESFEENELKKEMQSVRELCKEKNLSVAAFNGKVSSSVKKPVYVVKAVGSSKRTDNKACPGDDVIVTKWVGLEGTKVIAYKKEEELTKKFPARFVYEAKKLDKEISVETEKDAVKDLNVTGLYAAEEGGIFGALWNMADASNVGLKVFLKKIPIKQETVEICNYYDINPYLLLSGGSMIITSPDGNQIVLELKKLGIEATIIGKCTDDNDRVVISEDFTRFLEPAKPDELYKVQGE